MKSKEPDSISKFLFEIGKLKRTPRSGWLLAGVCQAESIAEHTMRTILIGYILAVLEGADKDKVMLMCLLHDFPEARTGDIDAIGKMYIKKNSFTELQIFLEQIATLPKTVSTLFLEAAKNLFNNDSIERNIVTDADRLECLVQAIEYDYFRNGNLEHFLKTRKVDFITNSAQKLFEEITSTDPSSWIDQPNQDKSEEKQ